MKLDKIKFAKVVQFITDRGWAGDVEILDDLIDIDVEPVKTDKVDPAMVDELLREIANPDGFINAIKVYRMLTGALLKESKEAIERYRNVANFPKKDENAMLGDILGTVPVNKRPPVNFDKFEA